MRLERLDLLAYGHFADYTLDFSPPARLHVVYGPNEAGKSTTLAAITELLFGVKFSNHPYDFKHKQLLLGGALKAADGGVLEFARKRTNKGAGLMSPDQKKALPDDALTPFLLGVGRDEFERLHALDHGRLQAGGREMLNPDSDIGRKLFAAGAGLGDLHRVEKELAAALDGIGGLNGMRGRQGQRLIDAGRDHDAAVKEIKAASLKAGDLARARDRLAAAGAAVETARQTLAVLTVEQAQLARAHRTRPLLAELDRLREAAAGQSAAGRDLPPELAEQWRAAQHEAALAEAEWRRCVAAEQDAAAELAATPPVGPHLGLAERIAAAAAGLGAYRKAAEDLPKCQAQRRGKQDAVADGLRALGLELFPEAAESRMPSDVDMTAVRHLAGERRACRQAQAAAVKGRDKAAADAAAAEQALAALGPDIDAGEAQGLADQAARLDRAPEQLEEAEAAARVAAAEAARALAALTALGRWSGDGAELAALTPPAAAVIAAFEADADDFKGREKAVESSLRDLGNERIEVDARIEAARVVGEPPGQAAVAAARRRRDYGVALLAAAAGGAPDLAAIADYADGGDLADAVTAAVADADRIADRRLAEIAQVHAYEAALARRLALTARLEKLAQEQAALREERAAMCRRWDAAWGPVKAGRAVEMRDWLAARQTALERLATAEKAAAALDAAQQRLQRWAALWRAAAAALGFPDEDAAVQASRVQNALQNLRRQAEQRRFLSRRQEQTAAAAQEADGEAAALTDRLAGLDRNWAAAMPRLGQPADLSEGALETVLARWSDISLAVKECRELDHRILGMQRDMAAFEACVAALRADLAAAGPDDLPGDAGAAVAALQAGLKADEQRRTVLEQKKQALTARQRDKAAADRRRQAAAAACHALRAAHGLDGDDDVLALCAAAAERRGLRHAVAAAERRLLDAGDSRPEAELRREAEAEDGDAAGARLAALTELLAEAQGTNDAARTELGQAQAEWDRLQQEAGAESAARRRNEAARRAGLAADELLQLKAAQILLRRAVERYREANQDPLLARASASFAAIAGHGGGSDQIVGLESRVGADNRPTLHAVRRGGGAVTVEGLSEGTGDQLFLALRLAALEQRATAGRPLPFIADDIFQTSDDARTEAGLRLLAELGRTTQVIVFTHHAGVAAAAARAADGAVNLIELAAPPAT